MSLGNQLIQKFKPLERGTRYVYIKLKVLLLHLLRSDCPQPRTISIPVSRFLFPVRRISIFLFIFWCWVAFWWLVFSCVWCCNLILAVTFSRMDPEGKLLMGFRKASNSILMQVYDFLEIFIRCTNLGKSYCSNICVKRSKHSILSY